MTERAKQLLRIVITAVAIGVLGFFVAALLLQPFFTGHIILPQSIHIGKVGIQFYGMLLGLGALAGYWLAMRRKQIYQISSEIADNIIFFALLGGFLGARLYHIISELPYYLVRPSLIIAVWNGGLSIYGAALGGALAIYLYQYYGVKNRSLTNTLNILDWLTPSIIVGQIIGRFGNFVNYELYGSPTNWPWKMFVPQAFRNPPYELNLYFHPLFLYEAAGSTMILVVLLKLNLRGGRLFLTWLLLYNVMRFFLEFLRVGSITYGGIRVNAFVSLALVIISGILLASHYVKSHPSDN
jgi:phosphatidylglycerol---prolipoprotein diacylglyceryl transferase